ncbi:hypothetical protein [Lysobacter capsici]|uniref:hypothetical protein n=1 Tax=Lysobacter capsici TaxID=435897 RepID=UPI00398CF3DC
MGAVGRSAGRGGAGRGRRCRLGLGFRLRLRLRFGRARRRAHAEHAVLADHFLELGVGFDRRIHADIAEKEAIRRRHRVQGRELFANLAQRRVRLQAHDEVAVGFAGECDGDEHAEPSVAR